MIKSKTCINHRKIKRCKSEPQDVKIKYYCSCSLQDKLCYLHILYTSFLECSLIWPVSSFYLLLFLANIGFAFCVTKKVQTSPLLICPIDLGQHRFGAEGGKYDWNLHDHVTWKRSHCRIWKLHVQKLTLFRLLHRLEH